MSTNLETIRDICKYLAPVAIAYIGVLKNRSDIDRFAAAQRAKEHGVPVESMLRKRWYHPLFGVKKAPPPAPGKDAP